jgi:hypothetical protein
MSTQSIPIEKQFHKIYVDTLYHPFKEKHGDKWEDEPFWDAVEVFKVKSKEIGYDDPFERLTPYYGRESFQQIRDKLKAGPPAYQSSSWKSPFIGEKIDILPIIEVLCHAGGAKYEGKERIIILDFWATW